MGAEAAPPIFDLLQHKERALMILATIMIMMCVVIK
jgi:hypothetical protein